MSKPKVVLVGNPNVGKSVLFHNLTGVYATVSNYPGTTVEVARGVGRIGTQEFEVIDTPGMYALMPISEEERVARNIILEENPSVILQVIDAKNLARMLDLTLQLVEAGLPLILVLNMMDELRALGTRINIGILEKRLRIPVVPVIATDGEGMDLLQQRILDYVGKS
ncbi:MAG: 50S ribosome-binding GTPase [Planctomycetes bacterium]|nr:50S ribosome-binding GTPase [Planctomycetota bacterium]